MKHIIVVSIIITAFILQGCSDEFLETPPRAAESELSFYTNFDNVESATIGCYSALEAQGNYDLGLMMILGSIAGDDMEAGGRDASEIPEIQECDRFTHQPGNPRIRKIWGHTYRGIYHCNVYLKYFPEMLASGELTAEQTNILKARIGEVRFLRALYYFWLTQAFGGVVLMDAPPAPSELQSATRSTIKEVYSLIESDLNEAISFLPERDQITEDGRAARGAAQALLGKVILYESSYAKYKIGTAADIDDRYEGCTQRWAEALALFEAVINSPHYYLLGLNGETFSTFWTNDEPTTDAYRYIFNVGGDNQPGSIFEIQDIVDLNALWIQARGNGLTNWCTVRRVFYPGNVSTEWGWGWLTPKPDLLALYEPGDPRIKTTFGSDGDSALVTSQGWLPLDMDYTATRHCCRKYECSPAEYWNVNQGDWNRGPINEKLIRLADVYLMAAEAAYEINPSDARALEYVNIVRRRADMCDGTEDGIPSQLASVTMDDIRNERRFELTGEGHRFFDLVRWGVSEDVLDGSTLVGGTITVSYESPKNDFFPIPTTEIDAIGGSLKQYQGW